MKKRLNWLLILLVVFFANLSLSPAPGEEGEQSSVLLQTSLADSNSTAVFLYGNVPFKPYISELTTPNGKNLLRDAPYDHLHHHALMLALYVENCDFWGEFTPEYGKQVVTDIQKTSSSQGDTLTAMIDWINPATGKKLLVEKRVITLLPREGVTQLCWKSTLQTPTDSEPVTLGGGGGHYFGLGIRFEQSMDDGGTFFNSTGKNEGETVRGDELLTKCRWMAYSAKYQGEPVTAALLASPQNPIEMTAFTMGDQSEYFAYLSGTMNLHRTEFVINPGEPVTFTYHVLLWDGTASPEKINKIYTDEFSIY